MSKGLFVLMTGLSGSGKTTIARYVVSELKRDGFQVELIDGDEYRKTLCKDLGFSREDRKINVERLSFVANKLSKHNIISILSTIAPYEEIRIECKKTYPNSKLIFVDASIDTVIKRDPKGLYEKALLPEGDPNRIDNFTGISDPFEAPSNYDLKVNTEEVSVAESAKIVINFIKESIK